jgi:putative ABC transport system permease protein
MNLELIEGRSFSKEFNDSLSLIINESAVKEFKLENPIGTQLYNPGDGDEPTRMFTVIGIVKDFHYNSFHDDIKSFVLWSDQGPFPFIGIICVKLKESNTANTLEHIENKWLEFVPDQPVSYTYLEDNIFNMYKNEQITSNIFGIFSLLAILIACVGLFGLAAYTATKRIKEIGVRKVMGASVSKIVGLLSFDFTKLVLIAFILAIPAGYVFMKKWLLNFAYKTDISVWIFLLAGGIALFIALVTISIHSIKAANSNPADSLRYE